MASVSSSLEATLPRVSRGRLLLWIALGAITLLGLALRIDAAQGDLWLDEIWSLDLVARITSIDQVLWRINHDNNHFLNSAWLYLTGPDASPLVQRAQAILFGAATPLAAAAVLADRGRVTQLTAAMLFAVSYPMVHYGSEARGYSGLILFTLLAVWGLERRLDGRGSGLALAFAVLFGFLSHLTMAATVLVLVAWTGWTLWRRGDGLARAMTGTVMTFLPAFILFLPLAACMAYGISTYGFTIGGSTPFSLESFFSGYGGVIRYLSGLLWGVSNGYLFAVSLAAVVVGAWFLPGRRSSLYLIGIVGLPLLMLQLRLPNLQYPRYFLPSAVFALLFLAEWLGRWLGNGGWRRGVAALAVAAYLYGNAISLWRFQEVRRGSNAEIVAEMTLDGKAEYAASSEFRVPMVLNFFASRSGQSVELVAKGDVCSRRPEWYVAEFFRDDWPAETYEVPGCDLAYDGVAISDRWGLSGIGLALYRKR